jgi:hypothetical protein
MAWTNTTFIIHNINSEDLHINGVHIVRTDGQVNTPWISGKSIVEDRVPYKDTPYHYGVQKQPLEFTVLFNILDDEYTEDTLYQLGLVFGQDKYIPFQTTDFLGKIFYVMPTSPISLTTFSNFKGWYEVSFRNKYPYALTLPRISTFDLSTITEDTTITLTNESNVMHPKLNDYYFEPELWIDLKGSSTSISLINQSDGGREFSFTGLTALELLYVNNQQKQIISSTGLYRLNKFNKNWFRIYRGENNIVVDNPCILQFKSQFPVYI